MINCSFGMPCMRRSSSAALALETPHPASSWVSLIITCFIQHDGCMSKLRSYKLDRNCSSWSSIESCWPLYCSRSIGRSQGIPQHRPPPIFRWFNSKLHSIGKRGGRNPPRDERVLVISFIVYRNVKQTLITCWLGRDCCLLSVFVSHPHV